MSDRPILFYYFVMNLLRRLIGVGLVLVFLTAPIFVASRGYADDVYELVIKKQEQKAKTRWSLSEWIDTRDRMRMMDLWLALHSPSPYEFFVGGVNRIFDGPAGRSSGLSFEGAAYASIFGLGFERTLTPASSYSAEFLLRIFGYQAQGTNITLHAGLRSQDVRNAFAGLGMSLYLAKNFGLEGLYRRHYRAVPNSQGVSNASVTLEGGAFIDFNFLRVFLDYGADTLDGGSSTQQTSIGAKIFF